MYVSVINFVLKACTMDKRSSWKQAILFCSILRHLSSIRQSMAYWTSLQVKTVSPSELFPYPKILFTYQTLPREGWNRVHWTVISQCRCTPRQCPRAIIIPAIHCRPVNLIKIYHSNLCRRYCSSSHGHWSSHCFTETTNQPTCNSELV
jgi:hypothetical protein